VLRHLQSQYSLSLFDGAHRGYRQVAAPCVFSLGSRSWPSTARVPMRPELIRRPSATNCNAWAAIWPTAPESTGASPLGAPSLVLLSATRRRDFVIRGSRRRPGSPGRLRGHGRAAQLDVKESQRPAGTRGGGRLFRG
jgi:hypothetical protein